jgi:hypothetical protein
MIPASKTAAFAFWLALAGLYALGYVARTEAQAQPRNPGAMAPSPRFTYGPGNSGFGYYG